jgi:hypothetical protein
MYESILSSLFNSPSYSLGNSYNDKIYSSKTRTDLTTCPETLLLQGITIGDEDCRENIMPATEVVTFSQLQNYPELIENFLCFNEKLRELMEKLINQVQEEEEALSLAHQVHSHSLLRKKIDIKKSLIQLLQKNQYPLIPDEAPLTRLLILRQLKMSNDWWSENTRLVQEFSFNIHLDTENCKAVWSPAVAESRDEQIGSAPGTSYIWVKSLTEYTQILDENIPLIKYKNKKDKKGNQVYPGEVLFIPVKAVWNGYSWLIPYILAHTTTKWWNHALQVQLCCRAEKDTERCSDLNMILSAIPKSSTVIIDGAFKHVCLVLFETTIPIKSSFDLSPNFKIGPRGNNDFARLAHAWLGRIPNPEPYSIGTSGEVVCAYNTLCKYIIATPDTIKRTFSIVAELTTSFFMGWSVLPKEENVEKNEKVEELKSQVKNFQMLLEKQHLELIEQQAKYIGLVDREREIRNEIDRYEKLGKKIEKYSSQIEEIQKIIEENQKKPEDDSELSIVWPDNSTGDSAHGASLKNQLEEKLEAIKSEQSKIDFQALNKKICFIDLDRKQISSLKDSVKETRNSIETLNREIATIISPVRSTAGPYVFNQKQPMNIFQNLVDICDLTLEERRSIISGYNSWRVSPLGYLQASEVDVGDPVRPMFREIIHCHSQYSVSQATHQHRVLKMFNIFCDSDRFIPCSFKHSNHIQAIAMALAGVGNITLLLHQVPIVDLNGISKIRWSMEPKYKYLFENITKKFSWPDGIGNRGRLGEEEWVKSIQRTIGLTQNDINCWYSLPLPWWVLNAFIKELSGKPFESKLTPGLIDDFTDDDLDSVQMIAYHIFETDHPFELSYLAASRSYERDWSQEGPARFLIKTPRRNLQDYQVNKIGWNSLKDRDSDSVFYNGVVELGAIVLPVSRKFNFKRCNNAHPIFALVFDRPIYFALLKLNRVTGVNKHNMRWPFLTEHKPKPTK